MREAESLAPPKVHRLATMVNFSLTRIDSGFDRGAYFGEGGYDPLLAPFKGTVNVSSRSRPPLPRERVSNASA